MISRFFSEAEQVIKKKKRGEKVSVCLDADGFVFEASLLSLYTGASGRTGSSLPSASIFAFRGRVDTDVIRGVWYERSVPSIG